MTTDGRPVTILTYCGALTSWLEYTLPPFMTSFMGACFDAP